MSNIQYLFSASDWASTTTTAYFYYDTLVFYAYQSGGYSTRLDSTQVFRDTGAWQHLLFTWDSTNAASSDRMRIYVNSSRVTA
ncbi:hypothetical protein, partial [Streptococcus pneumoniae]|uniref:hypothetical protein n=1 Tax=Streptococcus pneumoniae TaxID=1313 RepID=UPI001E64C785